ncbi:MAG: HEAT repeat domain-containing protein, partial [Actinobacteria bacterium]|nr:HEAT repeat domain-containing protein [Actinomycetota bacterium]
MKIIRIKTSYAQLVAKVGGVKMDIFGKKPNVKKIRVNKDVEGLIRALKYKDKDIRWEAVEALVKIGEPAVELLIEAL